MLIWFRSPNHFLEGRNLLVMLKTKIAGVFHLIRPINSLMMGLAVIIGVIIASTGELSYGLLVIGFSVAFTITGGTMAFNDYYDVKADEINEPQRPIPSGILSSRDALITAFIMVTIGIILSALINFYAFMIAISASILMIYYNSKGKKTGFLGNIVVSICVAIPFIFGGAIIGKLTNLIIIFSILAFTSNLGREIVKGIADIKGDRITKVSTLPIIIGIKNAAIISSAFILFSVALSFIPLLMKAVSSTYIPFIAASDAGFIWSAYSIIRSQKPVKSRKIKNLILIWMFLALLGFLMGGFKI